MDTLTRCYTTLRDKASPLTKFIDYYEGTATPPLVSERLREVYQHLNFSLVENWAAVVVDSVADRITCTGFHGPDDASQAIIATALDETGLLLELDDALQMALIAGEAYLIAWKDADGAFECYYNDPRMCHVFYDEERPNIPTLACKWWDAFDAPLAGEERAEAEVLHRHIKIYTPNKLTEYSAPLRAGGEVDIALAEVVDAQPNPFGVIPVFHLRPHRRRMLSELHNVIPIQDGINILLTNMFVTAEYSAAPMKYVISNAEGLEDLVVAPNRIWRIPKDDGLGGGSSQVGQFSAADLGNYLSAIEHAINSLSSITRTPKHYFQLGQNAPSGEALKVMEAPLVKKCQARMARFEYPLRALASFLCLLGGSTVPTSKIGIRWDAVETIQPQQEAATRKAQADAVLWPAKKRVSAKIRGCAS